MRPQDALQAAADSASVAADSIAQDVAGPDSTDIIGNIGREVGETGRLLASGDVGSAVDRIQTALRGMLEDFLPLLIGATFVFLVFYVVYRVLYGVLEASLRRSTRTDEGLKNLTLRSFRIGAWIFIGIMVLAQFGVDVTALLAGLSIAGIAVGFAARDTLENFISGVTIMLDRPFRVGDWIDLEGTYGCVQEVTLRSTRLRTLNDQVMVMPNISMISNKLINHSLLPSLRVEIGFGIAYKEFPAEAREVVMALFEDDERLDETRAPTVVVTGMGDSSVDMVARFHITDPALEVPLRLEYAEKIREALREADIEIPFPHLQLFIDGADGLKGLRLTQTPHDSKD
ncbi:MAG: mechanosensitive ion channel family protein [Rhodothermales bacterium]|nr:mechanosensitive ion channel family protein [Rhodothermales bacterium]MBO6779800.1 mechanosensitive ion channel family protein [Rhodothermales bacterium]